MVDTGGTQNDWVDTACDRKQRKIMAHSILVAVSDLIMVVSTAIYTVVSRYR